MSEDPSTSWPAARPTVALLAGFAVLGVLGGLLWAWLVDPVQVTRVENGVAIAGDELARQFDADAWFSLIGATGGLLAGVLVTAMGLRRSLSATTLVLLCLAGAVLATATMLLTGRVVGPASPQEVLAAAEVGATASATLVLHAAATYLVWPVATLVGVLVVLLSGSPGPGDRAPR